VSSSFLRESTVEGEQHTFAVLGLHGISARWEQLKANFQNQFAPSWVDELERSVSAMLPDGRSVGSGAKQVMSPFVGLDLGYTFLPVLSRVEKIDDWPRLISVIFIPMPSITEHSADMELHAVPPRVAAIIRMLEMARRARWEVLVPFFESIENLEYRPQLDGQARLSALRQEFARFQRHLMMLEEEAEKAHFKNPTYARALLEVNSKDIVPRLWFEYEEAKTKGWDAESKGDIPGVCGGVGEILDINKEFLWFGLRYYLEQVEQIDWKVGPRALLLGDVGGGRS
jgi:hypothetical protein